MISKRIDYSIFLNSLRLVAEEYYINNANEVLNAKDEKVENQKIILNTRFYTYYCMAYKKLAEIMDNHTINAINEGFIKRALSDYNVFNSFINNCVNEYNMYSDVGTGYILYYPYNSLSDFFFKDKEKKSILIQYLNSEISTLLNNNEKIRVKKMNF